MCQSLTTAPDNIGAVAVIHAAVRQVERIRLLITFRFATILQKSVALGGDCLCPHRGVLVRDHILIFV